MSNSSGGGYAAMGLQMVSTGMQMNAIAKTDEAQAQAEERNASFFREQADFAKSAGERERNIFKRKKDALKDEQISRVAKSGAAFGGSFARVVAQTDTVGREELGAIDKQTSFDVRMALLRADEAEMMAREIRYNSKDKQMSALISGGANVANTYMNTSYRGG